MTHVPDAKVSIIGGVQPGVLKKAITCEHLEDGLCARLLLSMPDQIPIVWTEATVDDQTEQEFSDVFDNLLTIQPDRDKFGKPQPVPLDLTPEAKEIWVRYYNRHREEFRHLDNDLAAAWSKLEAYAARFALIIQLCSWADGSATSDVIEAESVSAAIELSDWFGREARKVYTMFSETDEEAEQRELIGLVQRLGGVVTVGKLQSTSRKYRGDDSALKALKGLAKSGFGSLADIETGGRPSTTFTLCIPE